LIPGKVVSALAKEKDVNDQAAQSSPQVNPQNVPYNVLRNAPQAEPLATPGPSSFEEVQISGVPRRRIRRGPSVARITPTGVTELTAQSTDDLASLAPEGAREFLLWYRADKAKGRVAVYAAKWGTPGCDMFRRDTKGGYISFHLGDVFDQYPSLRPPAKVKVPAVLDTDEKGRPFLSINIKGGVVHTPQTRTGTDDKQ
jgi:hypothetical protein